MAQASPDQATADSAAEAEDDPEAHAAGGAADPEHSGEDHPSDGGTAGSSPTTKSEETPATPPPSTGATPTETVPSRDPSTESAPTTPHTEAAPPASAESSPEGGGTDSGQLDPAESSAALASVGEGGAEPSMGGGGGGGGGGAAAKEEQPEAPPDVASQPPEAGLASLNGLPPTAVAAGLKSVSGAVSRDVGQQRAEHAANPPKLECPTGSPVVKSGPTPVASAAAQGIPKTKSVPGGADRELPAPPPLAAPPPAPTHAVAAPVLPPTDDAKMSEADAQQVQSSVGNMPTSDPGLAETAGPAPEVPLSGASDPAKMQTQRGELSATAGRCEAQGQRDAAQPLGEDQIYPTAQPETLQAETGGVAGGPAGGPGAALGGAAGGGGDNETAVSIIAQKQSGPQIQAAVTKAQGDIAQRRQEHQTTVENERANNREQVTALETENAGEQSAARNAARGEVRQARTEWTSAQQDATVSAGVEADSEALGGTAQVQQEAGSANQEAGRHITSGNTEAAGVRRQAEADAAQKRQEAKQESGGVLGWVASKAKAFFDRIKRGITAIFDKARALVRKAIEAAKKLAVAAIERARKRIVALIRRIGAKLIAIGDKLLAAFPKLRERFRQRIKQLVEKAEAAVNRLAKALKKGVQRLLDLLGKAINAALGLLEKGLKAAVDAANAVVQGAIKAARAVADAFGAFIALVKDVAADPGGWIAKLGAAVVDGIRNHLWKAFKTAIKNWFNEKLEEVLGLPGMIWGLLRKGGIAFKEVGKMAWEALKSAIPVALITILVEKLVAMVVPAAGAVIAIIEGLQAAWGTVSRIIAAFGKFFAFLKAVRGGGAGPQFAEAVAAAAVVVIDFVSHWLLKKVRGAASKVGSKVKAIAQKIMARLKRGASRIGKTLKRVGAKALAPFKRAGEKFKQWREKRRQKKAAKHDPAKKQQDKEAAKKKRVERAIRETTAEVQRMVSRGTTGILLRAKLMYLMLKHRWKRLDVHQSPASDTAEITGEINPKVNLSKAERSWKLSMARVRPMKLSERKLPATVPAGARRTGNRWESAMAEVASDRFQKVLGAGVQKSATLEAQKTQSISGEGKPGQEKKPDIVRKPDWTLEESRSGKVTAIHAIEATLVLDFDYSMHSKDPNMKHARHKLEQVPETLFILGSTVPQNIRVYYHILAPGKPGPAARRAIEGTLRDMKIKNAITNVSVVWHVVG